MDIRQLRYFIAIAEEGQISAAAKRLHISQPPLSQQLKAMEEKLNTKLVERNGRSLELTEAGKILYKRALKMADLMEETTREINEVKTGESGALMIGVNTFSFVGLPELLHQFHRKYPKVTYRIHQNESSRLCELVKDRTIELAIVRLPIPLDTDGFSSIHLQTEPFYFLTSIKKQRFNHQLMLSDIHNHPLILPTTEGLGHYYIILEAFSKARLKPNIIAECSDVTVLLDLVARNVGKAIVPETIVKRYLNYNVHATKITDTEISASTVLIWMKNRYLSKAAYNFIQILTERL